jgi:hypothetical protein
MARRSLLTPAREERPADPEPVATATAEPLRARAGGTTIKPSRQAKLHIGGYYDPNDPTIVAFQKLGIDLRTPQQAMLLEAIGDFVAKHTAAKAFR